MGAERVRIVASNHWMLPFAVVFVPTGCSRILDLFHPQFLRWEIAGLLLVQEHATMRFERNRIFDYLEEKRRRSLDQNPACLNPRTHKTDDP